MVLSGKTYRNFIVASIYTLSAIIAFRNALFGEFTGFNIVISIVLAFSMVEFCTADARLRNETINHNLRFPIFLAWQIAVPFYIFKSRGIKGLWDIIPFIIISMAAAAIALFVRLSFDQNNF